MPASAFIESKGTPAGGYSRATLWLWFRVPWPPPAGWKAELLSAGIPELYRCGLSVCVIAEVKRVSRAVVRKEIRRAGLAGQQWCPQCRKLELASVKARPYRREWMYNL